MYVSNSPNVCCHVFSMTVFSEVAATSDSVSSFLHCNGVLMSAMASQITGVHLLVSLWTIAHEFF